MASISLCFSKTKYIRTAINYTSTNIILGPICFDKANYMQFLRLDPRCFHMFTLGCMDSN